MGGRGEVRGVVVLFKKRVGLVSYAVDGKLSTRQVILLNIDEPNHDLPSGAYLGLVFVLVR